MLMRVLLCKIHCPFICFCKPPSHIYTAPRLQLENSPHESSTTILSVGDDAHCDGVDDSDHVACDGAESTDVEGSGLDSKDEGHGGVEPMKSSLRKTLSGSTEVQKKKVQWLDVAGKELAEIREFEPCELEHLGYDGGKGCVCVIL